MQPQNEWCKSAYPTEGDLTPANAIILMVFNAVIALSNITVNSFLVFALKKTNQLKTLSIKFIICLSLSDLSIGLILQPIVMKILWNEYKGEVSCPTELAGQAVSLTLCHFSGVMMAIISLDRYIHVRYANRYSSFMSKSRAIALVSMNVVVAVTVAVLSVIASLQRTYFIFDLFLSSLDTIVVFCIWLYYILMFKSIRMHMKSVPRDDITGRLRISSKTRADAVIIKTIILLMTSQAICYFPYFAISSVWSYSLRNQTRTNESGLASWLWWSFVLVFANSCASGIIFILRNPNIKKKYFGKFGMFKCSPDSSNLQPNSTCVVSLKPTMSPSLH